MLTLLLACSEAPVHRNILWISLDTVGAEHLSLYDGPVSLPALDSLGGRVYERAFTHFPEAAVSHWTMLTGTLPDVHGDVGRYGGSASTGPTMAAHSEANGYATAAFIGGITGSQAMIRRLRMTVWCARIGLGLALGGHEDRSKLAEGATPPVRQAAGSRAALPSADWARPWGGGGAVSAPAWGGPPPPQTKRATVVVSAPWPKR